MGRPRARFSHAALERFRERLVPHLRAHLLLQNRGPQQNSLATSNSAALVAHRPRKVKKNKSAIIPKSHEALLRIRSVIVAQLRAHIAALQIKEEEANDTEQGKCSVIAVPGTDQVSSNARICEEDPGYVSLAESVASNSSGLESRFLYRARRRNMKKLQKSTKTTYT
ncbi:hypothetical protein O6H91_16G070300 [Diphasiastrum complanatum]|uniref:Uncharacterized protein n=1 Tax=Diphasiastrum complanatum TaxID=34168 RepID=A0ACC2BDD6_DIPCM|nr:hypothetical protein O6H91_16G070300 [Diphasiastrum complanatum]